MIFNGPRLLITPKRGWTAVIAGHSHSAVWLVAAALTAAVLPAAAVVVGHLGSAISGYEENATATLRAAIGFTSVAGGALVMAPALTLLLQGLTRWSRGDTTPSRAAPVAMGILWPVWTAGIILAIPPFVLALVMMIGSFVLLGLGFMSSIKGNKTYNYLSVYFSNIRK